MNWTNKKIIAILKTHFLIWNNWRSNNSNLNINLSRVNLSSLNLNFKNLSGIDFSETNFRKAQLTLANLSNTNLRGADFYESKLDGSNLTGAYICGANLGNTDLAETNFTKADLCGASLNAAHIYRANFYEANLAQVDLMGARVVETNIEKANIDDCKIYGISVWNLKGNPRSQSNLIITRPDEPTVTVDNLKLAQFIYLLINNKEIRDVIDTVAKKAVLILGRFTPERLEILQAIRNKLRELGYVPIIFDFTKPDSHDFIETVSTLAHISKFVIADFTEPKIVLEEVPHIARTVSVPIQPLCMKGIENIAVTPGNLRVNHRSILDDFYYEDIEHLMQNFEQKVLYPAESMAQDLLERKRKEALRGQE
ncbi:pentapeptide repeat-containing protein [Tolypothrix sp. FACHB-123]|uniref:pentapeptide repeat-containing protein n=1 Tax=Tolypothrix sp. FACHB-123 TaxID=2692868 RepID=UPI001686CDC4|nr:pentapeptide repeat-containing protein [Tolypothrix sp. FACHB-123]MBD2358882.1 pentapeptide repeat-containing protein [Tolypothrix sp. FACHB-123]